MGGTLANMRAADTNVLKFMGAEKLERDDTGRWVLTIFADI